VVWVTALSLILTPILDTAAARVSRTLLHMDASKTLWGTLTARSAAWAIAWLLVRRVGGRHD
jgi:hypothetical protein